MHIYTCQLCITSNSYKSAIEKQRCTVVWVLQQCCYHSHFFVMCLFWNNHWKKKKRENNRKQSLRYRFINTRGWEPDTNLTQILDCSLSSLFFEIIGRRIRAITLEERFDLCYIYAHVKLLLARTNSNRPCLLEAFNVRCASLYCLE